MGQTGGEERIILKNGFTLTTIASWVSRRVWKSVLFIRRNPFAIPNLRLKVTDRRVAAAFKVDVWCPYLISE